MRNHPRFPLAALCLLSLASAPFTAGAQTVSTYHNNNLRTGWDDAEKTLTVANVGGGTFGLQATTTLDSEVDSQPLVVHNQTIAGKGAHNVVYVVTGGDTLYAIDGATGAILASRNFGTPVPRSALPGACTNNGPTVGITSTPVIDTAKATMYLIADTYENSQAVMRLHAINLSTLQDSVTPVVITAATKLADGTTYNFNATVSRQRAALLLNDGKIYAGFSSYCDQAANATRGWMLGWKAATLTPIAHNQLQDAVPTSKTTFFLNAIWMSGYGPATADKKIYFVTSNSDPNTYGSADLDESVVKISLDLTTTDNFFTDPNHASLDMHDADLGSGGAMLAPPQPGENTSLLFAAGKGGTMYMFDRSAHAGLALLHSYAIGGCWCGASYFTGPDGVGRLVTSGGSNVIVWKLITSKTVPASLSQLSSTGIASGQDPGFFTTISSNGTTAGSAIIWAVGRPTSEPGKMPLYAIDPATGKIIYTAQAGNWTYSNANADTVPTVAGGHVYVATYQELAIFGLGTTAKTAGQSPAAALAAEPAAPPGFDLAEGQHAVWGTIVDVTYDEVVLRNRAGRLVWVKISAARQAGNLAEPVAGQAAVAIGSYDAGGVLVASNLEHAKPSAALWPQDQ